MGFIKQFVDAGELFCKVFLLFCPQLVVLIRSPGSITFVLIQYKSMRTFLFILSFCAKAISHLREVTIMEEHPHAFYSQLRLNMVEKAVLLLLLHKTF